jgi:hypothetical protein
MVTTIAKHASSLGSNICKDYKTLNATIVRHEALMRKRWLKKSAYQRRAVLLEAWPGMVESHRPDFMEIANDLEEALCTRDRDDLPSDACTWPYINLEDLMKPRSLLILLNTRWRNVPMWFALSEHEFSPFAETSPCGHEPELEKYKLYFSRVPEPASYGKTVLDADHDEYPNDTDGFNDCMRPALHVLYIQERIMRFLVECCRNILHDISDERCMSAPVLEEPSTSELSLRDDVGHLSFADSLAVAPYRNRRSLDIPRLRIYIESLLTNAKDHLWALREDPSYLHDTILELADHRYEMIPDSMGRIHPSVDTVAHKASLVHSMILDAYQMLCLWQEMSEVLEELETVRFDTSSDQFASLMSGLRCRVGRACKLLGQKVRLYAFSGPTMRTMRRRQDKMKVKDGKECFVVSSESQSCRSVGEMLVRTIFDCFDSEIKRRQEYGRSFHMLDNLDMLIRKNETVRTLISPQLATVITQLSLASECLFQHSLWLQTPLAAGVDLYANHEHKYDFEGWMHQICDGHFPVHLIDPARGKLRYPIHKARNRSKRGCFLGLDRCLLREEEWGRTA